MNNTSITGVMVTQRFTNLPIQLITALHKNLEEDFKWIKSQSSQSSSSVSAKKKAKHDKGSNNDNIDDDVAALSTLKYAILFSTCSIVEDNNTKKRKEEKQKEESFNLLGRKSSVIFNNFEEESYFDYADAAIVFQPNLSCIPSKHVAAALISMSKLSHCVKDIGGLLS
jgi:hypothetical protein